jgi:hypothetical protein
MIISVINHATRDLDDAEVHVGLRAINRQLAEDFGPHQHLQAQLRLEGKSTASPNVRTLPDLRGDAVLYLWDGQDVEDALGYHAVNARGIPYGFVFTALARQLGEPWTVTLSHEALEIAADPQTNLLVQGPHPADPARIVYHWYEVCDAVQAEAYEIDGVPVSNFVLPLYFTPDAEPGGRNDFLGKLHADGPVPSFGIAPGGYIGFFDPQTGRHEMVARQGDTRAAQRLALKQRYGRARRGARYQRPPRPAPARTRQPVARLAVAEFQAP